ncbi:MAG: 1-acyl-sn-glycerol-3-phosphate acyltransferase [Burkholderiaceae bacterium]|nr:MAG: 1-acyl-sn-glycerol-3-phosphate acyltransferase [Burkholderiaceae bacterium]
MRNVLLFLRAVIFMLGLSAATALFGSLAFFTIILPRTWRYRLIVTPWGSIFVWLARAICGIRYRIEGREKLPDGPAVLLSKHQSAWETVAYTALFPRQLCYVFKRELLYIPFFGWAIALMEMIHINRGRAADAFEDIVQQGKRVLEHGKWVLLFPEGTRTKVGSQGQYKSGGARLALRTDTPVVPIAVNSGECWPRNAFLKQPGLITISIGDPIPVAEKTPSQLNDQVEAWIENEMRRISPHAYHHDRG